MIYLSGLLPRKHPEFYRHFKKLLDTIGVTYLLLESTKDIWCRDYMPIINKGDMVSFKYTPPYLKKQKHLRTITKNVNTPGVTKFIESDLIIDGGNIVLCEGVLICTDAIFGWNPNYPKDTIIKTLKVVLKLKKVIVIPSYPGDIFRHADGVVKFLDEKHVFVVDDRVYKGGYTRCVMKKLKKHGINPIMVPYVDFEIEYNDSFTARGNYINVLETDTHLIIPAYGLKEDNDAVILYEKHYPNKVVVSINCNGIADEGGVLNCITWN